MIDLSHSSTLISGGPPDLIEAVAGSFQRGGATVQRLDETRYDVLDPQAVVAHLGTLASFETLVILPHLYTTGDFIETSADDWDAALRANFERATYLSQAAARRMIAQGVRGSIIFVSTVAVLLPQIQTSVLATSLAPLYPVAKMAAVDCGPHGIRVNTVAAGWLNIEWHQQHQQAEAAAHDYITADIPLDYIAEPTAIGDVCCFLASPLARYITGSIIPVDGGYSLTRSEQDGPYPPPTPNST